MSPALFRLRLWLLFSLCVALLFASILYLTHQSFFAATLLSCVVFFGSLPLIGAILASFVARRFGIDVIAITAVIGSALLEQYLVGTVILLMLATGEMLEALAFTRARKEIASLVSRAPNTARKKDQGAVHEIPVGEVRIGDILIIRPGDIVPVDGIVESGVSEVDQSAITGESVPIEKIRFSSLISGSLNQSGVLEIRATSTSENSQYSHIVRLVSEAENHQAPFVRMADRYSARFTLLTVVLALTAWLLSGDPLRVLAVLVVATPCPLILATPIAFASGIGRAAKRGIIVKNGGSLEILGTAKSFVFDKTGTLTLGTPTVRFIHHHTLSKNDILSIAASLEQFSPHIVARALVTFAHEQDIPLILPEDFEETTGRGVTGVIDKQRYFLGSLSYLEEHHIPIERETVVRHETSKDMGIMIVYLAKENTLVGDIHLTDTIRSETRGVFEALKQGGVESILMLTGDKEKTAQHIAAQAGIQEYRAECLPQDKIAEIQRLKQNRSPVVMVGDGINDAPALAQADLGIALGSNGSSAATDAGDIIITVNSLDRIREAFSIGKRVITIAKQGILFGIGASATLMILAALGYIPPVTGAILQEGIDVLAILNALRVHRS